MEKDQALLLSPYLTAYFNRRDNALGFIQPSFMARQTVSYYHAKQTETEQKLLQSASKVLKLKMIQVQIKAIIEEAETATLERKRELVAKAKQLRKQARNPQGGL